MKNSQMPAMPAIHFPTQQEILQAQSACLPTPHPHTTGGLTKLEHFAGLAMQGYAAADTELDHTAGLIAQWSVENAKALLAELEKQQ
jgi:hypothetical protein